MNDDIQINLQCFQMLNMEWQKRLQYICETCWQHIWEFHQFQQSVIEAQKGLHLFKEAAKGVVKVEINPELNINQQEVQKELHNAKRLNTSTENLIESTPLTFDIKSEEPLDINSDYDVGMFSHDTQLRDEEVSLNAIESNKDYSSSDDTPLSSYRQANLFSSKSKFASTKRSVQVFDELVALWRSPLECEICRQLLPSYSQMKEHFSKHHASESCYLMCCQLRLETRYDIENHIHYHNAPQQLKCEACCKAYRLEEHLRVHKRQVHTSKGGVGNAEGSEKLQGKYRCGKCSKDFATKSLLKRHNRNVHKPKILECNFCQKTFTRLDVLRVHVATHTGDKAHACSFCPETFTCRAYYCRHMRKYHLEEWNKIRNGVAPKETLDRYRRETRGECKVYVCFNCSMEYDEKHSMLNHLKRCQRYNGPIELKRGYRLETREESMIYVCIYCSKEYESRYSMYTHLKQCQGDDGQIEPTKGYREETRGESRMYVCIYCSKEYVERQSMINHIRGCQRNDGPIESKRGYRRETRGESTVYVCIYCSKEYEKQQSMHNHIRYCQIDDRSIESKWGYRREIRGENMIYICINCSKEYEKRQSMHSHVRYCQGDDRPIDPKRGCRLETRADSLVYICNYCSKEYEKRQSIRSHLHRCHREVGSLAKRTSINAEPPVPAEISLNTGITAPKTNEESNTTPDGDILNELYKKGVVEEDSLMTLKEEKELKDDKAKRTKVKTEQFSAYTKALVNEENDKDEMPPEVKVTTWESEQLI
uniref:C2H2-type domain-containing protein n=1 Tax=Stomoxys calcitrans TaxID=35570 RepID=A0A1I8Q5A9_STOCA